MEERRGGFIDHPGSSGFFAASGKLLKASWLVREPVTRDHARRARCYSRLTISSKINGDNEAELGVALVGI